MTAESPSKSTSATHSSAAAALKPTSANPDLIIERIIDAPRELVFKAWTDPKHLAQWWGPKGFTTPVCEIDVRPGGAIHLIMRAPYGVDLPMGGEFREVVEPERLVFTATALHDANGNPAFENLNIVTFEDKNGKTRLTLTAYVKRLEKEPSEAATRALGGMNQGWNETLDRLADLANRLALSSGTADREIVTTRVFDAPRELVFEVWTNPQHLEKWWGPNGFLTTVQQMEVKPGGVWRLVMHGPDGRDYNNKMVFLEVVKPERLVYKTDPEKGIEPVNFEVTVTFADRGGKTEVVMRMVFPSAIARNHVVEKYGALEGAKQTFDRLAQHLAEISK